MKKLVTKALILGAVAFGVTGCGEMISVKKQDNGAISYEMSYAADLPVNKGGRYNGYKIHRYYMDLKEMNGIVTVEVIHRTMFTMGSGTPNNGTGSLTNWMPSRFYHEPISFDIVGLSARKHTARMRWCSVIIDSCSESIKTQYTKKQFIRFFKKAKNAQVKIRYANDERTVYIPNMNKIQKYVECLENPASCASTK